MKAHEKALRALDMPELGPKDKKALKRWQTLCRQYKKMPNAHPRGLTWVIGYREAAYRRGGMSAALERIS
jgi:hypothetical protein